jgi:acyl-ACP thioesterase
LSKFDELVPAPDVGRVYAHRLVPGLADAAPGGRVRLDALARRLQDVAQADVMDAGVGDRALWVVRRARLRVERFPRFGETATVETFCSGLGRMWAQRRTTVTTGEGARVEAVALWVHLDPETARPAPLTEEELELYLPSAAGREVKARLRHPAPPADGAAARPWAFRTTDLDLAEHVNNSAYWAVLEDELLRREEPEAVDVELEFRTPAQPGTFSVIAAGGWRWVVADGGAVVASFALGPPPRPASPPAPAQTSA